jgi:hypothetical protein
MKTEFLSSLPCHAPIVHETSPDALCHHISPPHARSICHNLIFRYSKQAQTAVLSRQRKENMPNMPQNIVLQDQTGILAFLMANPLLFLLITIWAFFWKGMALWKAARLSHKWWFVIILIANTAGILEIAYIYFVARKYTVEETVEESANETNETKNEN